MKKKSDNKDLDNDDLNFDDLEGLEGDSGMDFGDDLDTSSRKPSVRDTAKELGKEAGKGFFDSMARKTAEKALPDSYKDNMYAALDYADFAKETFDTNKNKINKSLYKLGKEVKKIIPFQSKMLEGFLAKYETDFEEFKQQSQDEQRNASVASELSSMFDKQLEVQKGLEAKRSAEEQVDKKQRLAVDKISIDVLSSIDSHVATQSAFTLQISKEYYRKSLELQYKTYFIQADMLKDMRDYYKGFSKQFEDIAHNTAMPDFVKLHKTEAVQQMMRDQLMQSTYKQLFSNSDYVKNVKQKMANLVSEKVSSLTEGLDNATDALSGINQAGEFSGGGMSVLGSILSGMGGGILGEKAAGKIPKEYLEKVKGNRQVQIGGKVLDQLANSPRTFFASMRKKTEQGVEDYQDESSPLRWMASKLFGGANELLGVTGPDLKNYGVKKSSILDHNKPAVFDNKVHRSITEVIPLYLAKILAANTNFMNMYKSVNWQHLYEHQDEEEQVYNYESRELTTKSKFREAMQASVFKDVNKTGKKVQTVAEDIGGLALNAAEKAGDKDDVKFLKNKKSQKSFNEFMAIASDKFKAEDFNYENIVNNYDKNPDLADMVKKNPTLARYIEILQKNELSRKHTNLNEKVLDTKRDYPTLGVIELFKGVSKLVSSDAKNTPDGDVANKLAEGFTRYITMTNSMITLETIVNSQCFRMMTKADIEYCKTNIQIFVGQCKSIKASTDFLVESSFNVLLGLMNESLLNNFNIDPAVFQKLYDYSPVLQEDGKLGLRNLVQGKLGKEDENMDFVDPSVLKEISRIDSGTIKGMSRAQAKASVMEKIESSGFYQELLKFTDIGTELKTDLANANTGKEIGGAVRKMFKNVVKQSQESGKKFYSAAEKEFTEGLNKVNKAIESVSEKTAPKVKEQMLSTVNKILSRVEVLIRTEEESLKVMEAQLEEIKKTLEENIEDPKTLGTSKISLMASLEGKKVEIKTLKKFKGNLQAAANRINNIDTSQGVNVGDLLKSAFTTLQALKKEAEDTLAVFEAESKAQAEAATA